MINLNKIRIAILDSKSDLYKNSINLINKFYRLLNKEEDFIYKIEKEWTNHFKLIYGDIDKNLSSNKKIKESTLMDKYEIKDKSLKLDKIFFSIQTYYALLIKLIASKLISEYGLELISKTDAKNSIENILDGNYFLNEGISNYCYEDWFTWFMRLWDNESEDLIIDLYNYLEEYKDEDILIKESNSMLNNDYIKQIYEGVIPKELRHALGEYYTPDWLAEYTIDSVYNLSDEKTASVKILDPTCGSGTFIFKSIQWLRQKNTNINLSEITKSIKGFDINPLAVLTAKTNYLVATLDKIRNLDSIELPIYSFDVINTPKENEGVIDIDIDNRIFRLPSKIIDRDSLEIFEKVLKLSVRNNLETNAFIDKVSSHMKLNASENELMMKFYDDITGDQDLHLSMVWINLITNWIKAYAEKEFDMVIGNPPWINWEYMPKEYRIKSQHMWIELGIFSAKGKNLAFSKEDVSTLITYLAIDKFLKDKGHLAFIIRQGIFKSAQNGTGFRKFKIRNDIEIKVKKVDDLVSVKPFENATNQTAVMYLQKGTKNEYPVPYHIWEKKARKRLESYESLSEILKLIKVRQFIAKPSVEEDITSLWITGDKRILQEVDSCLGSNNYRARTGVFSGGANAVYWMNINKTINDEIVEVSNITARAKRKVEDVVVNIEKKYIYPLLKGSDVNVWSATPSIYMLCPHTVDTKMKPVPIDTFREEVPLTTAYLDKFRAELDERKGFSGWEKENQKENFHSVLRVGEYTFSRYKVVWRYISSDFITAVISDTEDKFLGKRMILPNEKVMYISTNDEAEAYYLCGILSSTPIALCIKSFMNPTSISTHVLEKLNIPDFDRNNDIHIQVSNICKQGHKCKSMEERKLLLNKINEIVSTLYGINKEMLKIISEENSR